MKPNKKFIKRVAVITAMFMLIFSTAYTRDSFASSAWNGTIASAFAGGSGTSSNPYKISTPEQLAYLASLVNNNSSYNSKYYELTEDIDLGGREWTPIGKGAFVTDLTSNSSYSFKGVFNGNGHTVSNYKITSVNTSYLGLFGNIYGGNSVSVANLHVSEFRINASSNKSYNLAAGGLAGTCYGIISSCGASNGTIDIKTTSGSSATCYAGGLVGRNQGGAITKSYAKADVSASTSGTSCHSYAGGLTGYNTSGNITYCYSICNTNSTSQGTTSAAYSGGFTAANGGSVTSSYSNSDAYALSKNSTAMAAGFTAYNTSSVTSSYATGNSTTVSSTKTGYGGGFAANISKDGSAASCFATGNVNVSGVTNAYSGGFAGLSSGTITKSYRTSSQTVKGTTIGSYGSVTPTNNFTKQTFFTSALYFTPIWDFSEVWTLGVSGGYEYPTLIPVPHPLTWAGNTASSFSGGNGTSSAPYEIATSGELALLANNVNNGNTYQGQYFKLTSNINLEGLEWIPIGRGRLTASEPNASNAFCGTFDGGNFTISNFTISLANTAYTGLFGIVYGGSISNLKVTDFNISASTPVGCIATIGAVAGTNTGIINNCYASGSVTGTSLLTAAYIGGLAGRNENGTISESISDVQVNAITAFDNCHAFAGGLAGYNENGTINTSYSSGEITAHTSGATSAAYAGGITAMNSSESVITDSYATGNITSISDKSTAVTGGFIGHNYGSVSNCYSIGNVRCNSLTKSGYGGGFIGNAAGTIRSCFTASNVTLTAGTGKNSGYFAGASSAVLTNCYYTTSQSVTPAPSASYASATSASNLKKQVFFTSTNNFAQPWNMTSVWTIGKASGYDYPTLINSTLSSEPEPPKDDDPNIKPDGWDGAAAEEFNGGKGTQSEPYEIATPGQLLLMANKVNENNSIYNDKYYILTDNIDLNYRAWTPIGKGIQNSSSVSDSNAFKGSFDGNGYTIENLKINRATNGFGGLFGIVYNGNLKNIILNTSKADFTYSSNNLYFGMIAGYINGTITDSYVNGELLITASHISSQAYIGSIAGYIGSGEISGCTSEGKITVESANSAAVGNIAGYSDASLTQNAAKSDITAVTKDVSYTGGIIGRLDLNGSVTDCYSTGKTSSESASAAAYAGGISGYSKGKCFTSYASGEVKSKSASSDSLAGGLFGYSNNALTSCFAVNNVTAVSATGNAEVGGIIGRYGGGTLNNCYRSTSQELDADTVNSRGQSTTLDNLKNKEFLTSTKYFVTPWNFKDIWQFKTGNVYAFPVLKNTASSPISSLDAWEGEIASGYDGGSGTSARPYKISNAAQLAYLAYMVNTGTDYSGTYFILTSDIDLIESTWIPIGKSVNITDNIPKSDKSFSGSFDGKGHTIKNMSITSPGKACYGLFGCVYNGTISNVNVENYNINITPPQSTNIFAGAVAGIMSGSITGCCSRGNIEIINAKKAVCSGGIAGLNYMGVISASRSLGSIKTSSIGIEGIYSGGISGINNEGIIESSYSSASINTTNTGSQGKTASGGIAGLSSAGEIIDCYNNSAFIKSITTNETQAYSGGITGYSEGENKISAAYSVSDIASSSYIADSYAGGIAGYSENSSIESALSIGNITAVSESGNEYGGSIIAKNNASTITKCYKSNQQNVIAGNVTTTGTAVSPDKFKDSAFLTDTRYFTNAWDFDSVWTIDTAIGYSYPILKSVKHVATDGGNGDNQDEASIEVLYDGGLITINSDTNIDNVMIIISAYKGNILTDTEIFKENIAQGENIIFTENFTAINADKLKIMLWDSAETQSQLTSAKEIKLK